MDYWKGNFKELYDFTARIFGLLMKEDEGMINCPRITEILYSKWYRSDPWCKGVWARGKMREIEPVTVAVTESDAEPGIRRSPVLGEMKE